MRTARISRLKLRGAGSICPVEGPRPAIQDKPRRNFARSFEARLKATDLDTITRRTTVTTSDLSPARHGCAHPTNVEAIRELGHHSWSGSGAGHVRLRLRRELMPSDRTSKSVQVYSRCATFQPNT